MKKTVAILVLVAAAAAGVYTLSNSGSNNPTGPVAQGGASAARPPATGSNAPAELDAGRTSSGAHEVETARAPAQLSGEGRDPNTSAPVAAGTFGGDLPLVDMTAPLQITTSANDNSGLEEVFARRYARYDSAQRFQQLEALNKRYELHLAGKQPEGEKALDELAVERLQLEMEWLSQHPGS